MTKQIKLLMLLATFCTSSIYSQLTQGNWLVGGSGSFYSYNQTYTSSGINTNYKYTSIDLSASVGHFIIDKLVVGLVPSFSYYKGTDPNQGTVARPTKFAIGPFARYYFLDTDKGYNLLVDARYQFGINKDPLPPQGKGKLSNFSIMAGPEIFFNQSVGMEILLGYKATSETIDNQTKYQDKRNGFQVMIGFQIHLEKK